MITLVAAVVDIAGVPWLDIFPAPDAIGPYSTDRHWWARCTTWLAESRSHRVICLVVAIWLLNAFDLTLTVLAHQQGVLHEGNPVAASLLEHGPLSLGLFKIGLVLIGSYPLLRYRRTRITELGALVVLVAYATLAIHWSTCYELYTLSASYEFSIAEVDRISGIRTR